MRVLAACSLGGAGHFNPLLPFLEAARHAGHEVLVAGPPALREMVESAGFRFRAGGEPSEEEVAAIRERLPVVSAAEASVLGNRDLFGRLATGALLAGMEEAWSEWSPELVLREPAEYASAIVAARAGTPIAQVAISLAEVEAGSIAVAAPALDEHRRGLADQLRISPYVTRFPASLDPSPFPTTVRFREQPRASGSLTPAWPTQPAAPLVYVTFGTVLGYMSMAAEVYRIALQAVAGLPVRALLTVGRRFDPSALPSVPDNVRLEAWVDQAEILAHADVVVCHGGSGTTLASLAAGVPLVLVPLFADQFENARRIAAMGAGRVVQIRGSLEPLGADAPPRIAAAIQDILGDASYRRRARSIAAEMAGYPSVEDILARLLG